MKTRFSHYFFFALRWTIYKLNFKTNVKTTQRLPQLLFESRVAIRVGWSYKIQKNMWVIIIIILWANQKDKTMNQKVKCQFQKRTKNVQKPCVHVTLNCSRKSAVDVEHFNAPILLWNYILLRCFHKFWTVCIFILVCQKITKFSLVCYEIKAAKGEKETKKNWLLPLNIVLFIVKAIKLHVAFLVLTWTNSSA